MFYTNILYSLQSQILNYYLKIAEPKDDPGCRRDDDCPFGKVCRNAQCLDPCADINPCAPNAMCDVSSVIFIH